MTRPHPLPSCITTPHNAPDLYFLS
jgi:hypothetical protein